MLKLSAVLLCIILIPCLCSCRETALPRAVKDKKPLALENYIKNDPPEEAPADDKPAAENPAGSAPETLPDSEPTSASEFSETPAASEPVFLEDIHEWADGNYLYNNNISFNRTDRFYIYSSFPIKGTDKDGKMLAYSQDRINDDTKPFRVESVCPSSVCDGEIKEVILYHFD